MIQQEIMIGQRKVLLFEADEPRAVLVQTLGRHEAKTVGREVELIRQATDVPFAMAAFDIADWDRELTPWPDPEVSRRKAVGYGAADTLRYVTADLLPCLRDRYAPPQAEGAAGFPLPVILGGYSLGGLFSLWAASQADGFMGIAACSPSLWIRDWLPFAEAHPVKAQRVYLSLGDREERAKNQAIARVGDCVRAEHELLRRALGDDSVTLRWEQGNHFTDGDGRMARGFAWCLNQMEHV